jgi:BASS family bile acid:Na+ symporter
MGITPVAVARVVLTTILAPLAAGIAFQAVAPALTGSLARPVSIIAKVLLLLGALPILITARQAMWSLIGNGTLVTLAAFVAVGLASGHLLGGPDPDERLTLAFSTASRHPGMALAIAHANFAEQKLAIAVILLYLLVSAIVTIPYQKWFQGRYPQPDAPAGGTAVTDQRVNPRRA